MYPPLPAQYPNAGTLVVTTSFGTGPECPMGHVVEEKAVEYYDGVVVAHCSRCGDRIILPSIPGGVSFLRIQTLLGAVMGLDEQTVELPGFDLGSIMELLVELREAIENEMFAVEEAKRLIDLAQALLEQKVQTTLDS